MANNARMAAATTAAVDQEQEQAFYQNVAPSSSRFVPPQHFPSPGGTPREVVGGGAAAGGDLYHASPRIAGTPGGPANTSEMGPEKPQRHYAYNQDSQPAVPAPAPVKKASQSSLGRVRFQEPTNTKVQYFPLSKRK